VSAAASRLFAARTAARPATTEPAVVRWALIRIMVMLVHAAKGDARSERGGIDATIRVSGDDATVSVRVSSREAPSDDLVALAARCGGVVVRTNDELVLTLPSLRELRRREREGRGESPTG